MTIEELRIGQVLTVRESHEIAEWRGETVTISGLTKTKRRGENVHVVDKHGDEYDGFKAADFYAPIDGTELPPDSDGGQRKGQSNEI